MIRVMTKTLRHASMVTAFRLLPMCGEEKGCIDVVDTFGSWYKQYAYGGDVSIIAEGNGGFVRMVWKRDQGVILNQAVALCGHKLLECNCTDAESDVECMWCLGELLRMDCKFVRELIIMWVSSMPKDKHEKAKKKLGLE
jgi:hypothetical protein